MKERILADRYRLTEQIGLGGMAIVYRAVDLRTGHNVAVKVLRPEFNEDAEFIGRFQREAEAASKMTHHNIVNLLDVGMDGENRYLVMEYVQGKTLKDVIQERGRLNAPLACQITIRILSALEHAHKNGIIHRDIKPQNILVHEDGHIKVADFGIARIADSSTLTKGENVMGSVHYFSPEQARGEGATAASDIYSTGIVLYEMLTGRVPFDGDNPVAVAMQHLHATPAPIQSIAPDVPPQVVRVCMKAMEKNPAMRYQSAREMATDLRLAMNNERLDDSNVQLNGANVEQPKPQLKDNRNARGPRKEGGKRKPIPVKSIVTGLIATAVVVAVIIFGSMIIRDRVMTSCEVPDVVTMTQSEAETVLEKQGLSFRSIPVASDEYPAGTVFGQAPKAGEIVRKNDTVVLNVSTGPVPLKMPDLTAYTYSQAVAALKEMGITNITAVRVIGSDTTLEQVVEQQPAANDTVAKDTQVTLTINGGDTVVPNLADLTLQEAEAQLVNKKLTLNPVLQYVNTEDPEKHGKIAGQSPEKDNHVTLNTPVSLKIYSYAALIISKELEIQIPVRDPEIKSFRVTLQDPDSNLEIEAVSYQLNDEKKQSYKVILNPPDNRDYIYIIYFDGVQEIRDELRNLDDAN